ncbi:class I adenylate-forming enzyme family protein [Nocardiopsis quinghaiensis]|uniref:long-chain fatty acid--CoA ligase n=1 Tax=Nocardiopsis quinghaiensis TaxID=464995 RepID=UPI00123ADAE1|nr:long-chain fatty acid--CoA ligase [Nocardiopsis quinghaiensis]
MSYQELTPAAFIGSGLRSDALVENSWTVRWDRVRDPEDLLADALGPVLEFRSSGTTSGGGRPWHRTWEQAWSEAGLLADLVRGEAPEAVLSFAPPRHLYGTLVSVLVPARLGLPVWYRPQFGRMPPEGLHRRWAVMAIPWAFQILSRRRAWIRSSERLAILHSTASLPSAAGRLVLEESEHAVLTEVFGSTESGGVATRRLFGSGSGEDWTLFDDVEFVLPRSRGDVEEPLRVRGPRLAFPPGGAPPDECRLDDHVRVTGDRSFRFSGRRDRLVNVNGLRLDLDAVEEPLREALSCADLACVPVRDDLAGEHFELLIAAGPGEGPSPSSLDTALSRLAVRPRRIRVVERIDRSETGKLRRLRQEPLMTDLGEHT